jgi:hypothetical protein
MRIVATARYIDGKTREQGVQVAENPNYGQVPHKFTTPQPSSSEMMGILLTGLPTPPEETSETDMMDLLNVMPSEDTTPTKTCRVPTMYRTVPGRPMSTPLSGLPPHRTSPTLRASNINGEDGTIYNEVRATSEQPPNIASSGIVGEGNEWMNKPACSGWR